MSATKQITEDLTYIVESINGETHQRYDFDGPNGPIIGIPGIFGGWSRDGLRKFMTKNKVKGVLLNLGNLVHGVDTYLEQIDTEVKKYPKPLLVGFSSGGFVGLRYAEVYKAWEKIKGIVTITTPFKGNQRKFEVLGKTLKETIPGGSVLKDVLNLKPPIDKVISIFAKEDEHTPKPETIKLNWPTIITRALSHGDVQNHQKWYRDELKQAIGITK